jgi:hypothetical protein
MGGLFVEPVAVRKERKLAGVAYSTHVINSPICIFKVFLTEHYQ